MSLETILAVLAFTAFGSYFQTVTGFGFSMIVIGSAGGLGLVPVAVAASVVNLLTLVNSAVALRGRFHLVDWPAARALLLGIVPAVIAGIMLLDYLSETAATLLKFLLGAVIVFSGVVFAIRPTQLPKRSHNAGFFGAGFFAGLFGGMFGIAGPPVILFMYRQPMELLMVRNMLILVFAFTAAIRTIVVGSQGALTSDVWLLAGLGVVLVALSTMAGRRFPPPLAPLAMRRLAFSVLIFIGLSVMFAAVVQWQNAA